MNGSGPADFPRRLPWMNKATQKILLHYVLAPLVLIVLLLLIGHQIRSRGTFDQEWKDLYLSWKSGSTLLIVLIVLLAPLNWALEAVKWHLMARKIEPISFLRALCAVLTGIAFSLVTPNKIGDFAGRILYLKEKGRLRGIIATLVGNWAHLIVTFVMGISGLIYFNLNYPGNWQKITLVSASVLLAALLFFYFRVERLAYLAERARWMRKLVVALRILKRYSRKDLLSYLGLSLLRFSVYTLQFLLLINVLGAGIPWFSGFLLAALMFWMIAAIPSVFITDIGVRGFVAGLLFTQTGISDNALAILAGSYFIWLLNLVLPAIFGSFLLLTLRRRKTRPTDTPSDRFELQ